MQVAQKNKKDIHSINSNRYFSLDKLEPNLAAKSEDFKSLINSKQLEQFIDKYFDLSLNVNFITSTSDPVEINKINNIKYNSILNFTKVNDIRFINKFFESVNTSLPKYGLFMGVVQTYPNRRSVILSRYPLILNWIIYILDYVSNRILPRIRFTKKLYFFITKGKGRVLSKAETYGRLYYSGFEILNEITLKNKLYFVARKIKKPNNGSPPSYGAILKLKRVGYGGKLFNVFKLRTMHPFSEYLQEYIYDKNKLQNGGKIKNDFRISPEGRIFRKIWLDELPMFFNLIKGEMKLVGVRPLSPHYYSLYDKNLKELRIQFKPGLIPPFYADMPQTLKEIMESEIKYLRAYRKKPLRTDIIYFFKAFYNIVIKRNRSN